MKSRLHASVPYLLICMAVLSGCALNSTKPKPNLPKSETLPPVSIASVVPFSIEERKNAVDQTIAQSPNCTGLGDFYWEIGDINGALAQGSVGTAYTKDTDILVSSASKFVFAAQVIEKYDGVFSFAPYLQMQSGYVGMNTALCNGASTVAGCVAAGPNQKNYVSVPSKLGRFVYNSAHEEILANSVLGMGSFTPSDLTQNMTTLLKGKVEGIYSTPSIAGGMSFTPSQYAGFLRAVINGELKLRDYLGANGICTLPGPSCPTALVSPMPLNWSYSYGHWIEDDASGDGAFSSPGAFGFYPWISKDKSTYGILARKDQVNAGSSDPLITPFYHSAQCGKQLRAAWFTGQAQ